MLREDIEDDEQAEVDGRDLDNTSFFIKSSGFDKEVLSKSRPTMSVCSSSRRYGVRELRTEELTRVYAYL